MMNAAAVSVNIGISNEEYSGTTPNSSVLISHKSVLPAPKESVKPDIA
jgi:hypothetical protein